MLEPLVVLTVLNCIFMFSSTVTTCALWWQHQRHRCCSRANVIQQKSGFKRSTNNTFGTVKKSEKSKIDDHVDVKFTNNSSKDKRSPKKRSKKMQYLAEYQRKRGEKMLSSRGPEARELEEKAKMSEASQTANDTKSTVVMEFSTVQKVVQIVDNDSEINPPRISFKDLVIRKDMVAKKGDHNAEQSFATNGKNVTVTDNS